jgi:hypothetical protein
MGGIGFISKPHAIHTIFSYRTILLGLKFGMQYINAIMLIISEKLLEYF